MENISTQFLLLQSLLFFSTLSYFGSSQEEISRSDFPDGFLFGTASSAFQIEGAYLEGGKGLSNWDVYSHTPGNIIGEGNSDIADDHYHLYLEDIEMMHSLGVNAYRFSISWSRILPRGRFGDVNPIGVMFYNKLIDNLIPRGIEPFVTINHSDLPQELEDRYRSWLSPLMQEDFVYLAETCFRNFGDRVKYWATLNEPNVITKESYLNGLGPPSHHSEKETLIAAHNMILAHTKATNLYRKHYQQKQGGCVGIVVHASMYVPMTDKEGDRQAAERALAFNVAWLLDPLLHGDYPPEMRHYLGDSLPNFTIEESMKLKGSIDFIGINHYTAEYIKDCNNYFYCDAFSNATVGFVYNTGKRKSVWIREKTSSSNSYVDARMHEVINYVKTRYDNKPIIVTENGFAQKGFTSDQRRDLLHDSDRVEFHKAYVASLSRAMRDDADVRGYFVWTLMDCFEWSLGYDLRFGLYHIDLQTLKRTPKQSAIWYRNFLTNGANSDKHGITRCPSRNTFVMVNNSREGEADV